jgi:hypothetical protein
MANQDLVAWIIRRALPWLTWIVLIWTVISHYISPDVFVVWYCIFLGWSVILLVESITCFVLGKIECAKYFAIDWNVKCQELTGESRQIYDRMVHLIILPNYKEEIEVLSWELWELSYLDLV